MVKARSWRAAKGGTAGETGRWVEDSALRKILLLVRNHRGVDFSLYKPSTMQRRIARRMVLSKCETLGDYASFLRGNDKELEGLYSDLLISVTSFFRNPEAFAALKREVFPKLLERRGPDGAVRVWVAGCSTGQEVYSIAMAYQEFCDQRSRAPELQIFGTDLNEALLERARQGLYPASLAEQVSPERLRRFFVRGGRRLSGQQGVAGAVCFCPAESLERSALLAPGPDQLPEPAHLHRSGFATEDPAHLPLRAQAERVSAAGGVRVGWARRASCSSRWTRR